MTQHNHQNHPSPPPSLQEAKPRSRSQKASKKPDKVIWVFVACGIIMAIFMGLELQKNTVYFLTPSEAKARAYDLQNQTIRVGGMVAVDSLITAPDSLTVSFVLTNLEDTQVHVNYHGLLPDMFKEGSGVVLEGKISEQGDEFNATRLMVKHSEEYVKPDSHKTMDQELLKKSLLQ
ncbi:MAG: cytochrome c maturation protein CcmE [Proteobacteria bacterium]|nr:cytochrome c maturation protein CcmE [Pseudomonadota bacterium]